ncbi:MAG TPA: hypothetical protein PKD74_03185 [Candidatus Dependentiae bacterium]|nr:hypothetical protein [Candidatus Dependentiae bacterium]
MNYGLIFGIILILWGISQLTSTIFHIHIPFVSILFGLFLVYLGIQVMTGSSFCSLQYNCRYTKDAHDTCMGTSYVSFDDSSLQNDETQLHYKTVFGTSIIDMTQLTAAAIKQKEKQLIVHIDTAFGKTILKLNKDIPVKIKAKGGFAHIVMPDNNSIAFGSHTFTSNEAEPLLIIYTTTAFGETLITR